MNTLRLIGWLYYVLFPYFLPLILTAYPFGVILYKLRQRDSVPIRDRNHFQIVLAVVGGYYFFHFLYYLLWMGRQIESLMFDQIGFRDLLSHHVWYIARPLFALINLGQCYIRYGFEQGSKNLCTHDAPPAYYIKIKHIMRVQRLLDHCKTIYFLRVHAH